MHAHAHSHTLFFLTGEKNTHMHTRTHKKTKQNIKTTKKKACCDFKNEKIEQLWVINRLIRVDKMKVNGAEHSLI